MRHATSRELYAYWDRVRGGEAAPRRSAIEPGEIRRILGDTFILEVLGRQDYVVRLAGTRMCSLYGREIRGEPFLDHWEPEDREAVAAAAAAVCEDAAAAVIDVELFSSRGRAVACEFLLLPLRHGTTSRDRILGSCGVHRRPYWFGTDGITRQSVSATRLIWPDDHPRGLGPSRSRLVALPPAFVRSNGGRRHGHLYVVDGGKS
ncbi:MAG TPA: PAS domain-containing protein [Bauldia sp.]|nr:PAS domain-containing protein [Bauldia sp.]